MRKYVYKYSRFAPRKKRKETVTTLAFAYTGRQIYGYRKAR